VLLTVVDVALIDVDDRCRMAFIHCLSSWQSLMELYGFENNWNSICFFLNYYFTAISVIAASAATSASAAWAHGPGIGYVIG